MSGQPFLAAVRGGLEAEFPQGVIEEVNAVAEVGQGRCSGPEQETALLAIGEHGRDFPAITLLFGREMQR